MTLPWNTVREEGRREGGRGGGKVTSGRTEQGRKSKFIGLSLYDAAEEEEKKRRGEEIIGDLGILQGRGRAGHIEDGWAEVYIKV